MLSVYPPCAGQNEQEEAVALRPPFRGMEYGYNNTVLACFSVAIIITIAKDKSEEKEIYFHLYLLFRGRSGQELQAGANGGRLLADLLTGVCLRTPLLLQVN